MPITPFHFGPGVLFKSARPAAFSWTMFSLVNIVIDLEPVLSYLWMGDPVHGYAHTYVGATLIAIVVARFGRPWCEMVLRAWNTKMSPEQARWLGVSTTIPYRTALVSALAGTWSHIVFDSVMHADIRPWWPLSDENSMRSFIDLSALHLLCFVAGLWGLLRLTTTRWDALGQKSVQDDSTKLQHPRHISAISRVILGGVRTIAAFVTVAILASAITANLDSLRPVALDADVWRNAATLSYTDPNPRWAMVHDAADQLRRSRPNRTETIELLGEVMHPYPEMLSYWAGAPYWFMWKRKLEVHFKADGSFDHAEVITVE